MYKPAFPKPNRHRAKRVKLRPSIPESQLQKMCEEYLDLINLTYIRLPSSILSAVFGKQSTMPFKMRQFMSSIVKGVADLTILHPNGYYLCVELKTETGKLSQAQKNWGKPLGKNYQVVRSFDEFKELIDQWKSVFPISS